MVLEDAFCLGDHGVFQCVLVSEISRFFHGNSIDLWVLIGQSNQLHWSVAVDLPVSVLEEIEHMVTIILGVPFRKENSSSNTANFELNHVEKHSCDHSILVLPSAVVEH